jgi:hypothetical protein
MANYLKIIGEFFPTASVQLTGTDPSVYSNIAWNSTQISQNTLDQYIPKSTNDIRNTYSDRTENAIVHSVVNNTASIILASTPVYSTGTDSLTGRAYIAPADSAILSKLPVVGIVVGDINPNTAGIICTVGILKGVLNTISYNAGDVLYVASGGGITNIKPTDTNQWQQVATVDEALTSGNLNINLHSVQTIFTQRSIDIPIFGTTSQLYRSSTSTSYTSVARFIYRGSNIFGPPSYIKAVCWSSMSSKTANVRLFDITNGLVIATSDTFNNTTATVIDLNVISNIPVNEAILEFQIITSFANNTVSISSGHIYFN